MPRTYCPSCDAEITVERPRIGATVVCPECGDSLEIVDNDPFELDYPLDDDWEEDWDDEWEDEEA